MTRMAPNTTLAELPPLPIAALMIGVYNLLQEGADLLQPVVSVSQTDSGSTCSSR